MTFAPCARRGGGARARAPAGGGAARAGHARPARAAVDGRGLRAAAVGGLRARAHHHNADEHRALRADHSPYAPPSPPSLLVQRLMPLL